MITVTFNFTSIAAAAALFGKLNGTELGAIVTPAVTAAEKTALLLANEAALADTAEPVAAPGKPASSAARTARSQPSAAAGPSTSAPSDAAPATAPTVTAAPADASSASQDQAAFEYATLQKAVNAAVPKHGKEALLAIAKAHGADNFKGLDASAWAAAHADVVALG